MQNIRASRHFDGGGIEYNIDWNATLAVLRSLRKGKHTAQYAALETVMAGACWPIARVHEAFPNVDPICEFCGLDTGDSLHVFWGCDSIAAYDNEFIHDSNNLRPRA